MKKTSMAQYLRNGSVVWRNCRDFILSPAKKNNNGGKIMIRKLSILSLIAVLAVAFTFLACSNDNTTSPSDVDGDGNGGGGGTTYFIKGTIGGSAPDAGTYDLTGIAGGWQILMPGMTHIVAGSMNAPAWIISFKGTTAGTYLSTDIITNGGQYLVTTNNGGSSYTSIFGGDATINVTTYGAVGGTI